MYEAGDHGDTFYLIYEGSVGVFLPQINYFQDETSDENPDHFSRSRTVHSRAESDSQFDLQVSRSSFKASRLLLRSMSGEFHHLIKPKKELCAKPSQVLHFGNGFGEQSLIDCEPRKQTVRALEDTHLLTLPRQEFLYSLKSYHDKKTQEKIEFFRTLFLTENAPMLEIVKLSLAFEASELKRHSFAAKQGQAVDRVFVIVNGTVSVQKRVASIGSRAVAASVATIQKLESGCFVELHEALNGDIASHSAVCTTKTSVLVANRVALLRGEVSQNVVLNEFCLTNEMAAIRGSKVVNQALRSLADVNRKMLQKQSSNIISALEKSSMHSLYDQSICLKNMGKSHHMHKIVEFERNRRRKLFYDIVKASDNFTKLPNRKMFKPTSAPKSINLPKTTTMKDLTPVKLQSLPIDSASTLKSNEGFALLLKQHRDKIEKRDAINMPNRLNYSVQWRMPYSTLAAMDDWVSAETKLPTVDTSVTLKKELIQTPAIPASKASPRSFQLMGAGQMIKYDMKLLEGDNSQGCGYTFKRPSYALQVHL